MREKIKNIGLILVLIIGGISLPTSIISLLKNTETTTIVNNYYYNTTIIEQYNTTIIEQYNYTVSNCTMEFYSFSDVPDVTTFFNKTYNITRDSIFVIAMTVINYVNYDPTVIIRKNNILFYVYDNDDDHTIVVSNGSYNIEITKTWVGFSDYNVELFIGIFW